MESIILIYVLPVVGALAIYLLKRSIDQMDKELVDHKSTHTTLHQEIQYIRSEYLHKNDFREFKSELRAMFEDLRQDIKTLRDKPNVP